MDLFHRRALCVALAVTAVVGLAACSSSGGAAKSGSTSTSAGASVGSTSAGSDAGLTAAKAEVAALTGLPTSIGITKPINKAAVAGKTVAYLECSIANCKVHADALADAFKPLGINLKIISSGLTPESFKNALTTVQSLHPDGVIYDAIPASIAQAPVDSMAAEGIAVVAIVAPDLKVSAHVANVMGTPYFSTIGKALADYTIVDSNGKANVLYVKDTTLSFTPFLTSGLDDAYAKNCSGCSIHELATNSGEIGTALPDKISSYLQANPGIKYINAEYSALLTGVPSALSTAGIHGVKLIGNGPTQLDQQAMQAGQEAANVVQSQPSMSWYATDTVARLMSGEQPQAVIDNPPNIQLLTGSQVTWDPKTSDYPWIAGWQQQFTKAWGVQG